MRSKHVSDTLPSRDPAKTRATDRTERPVSRAMAAYVSCLPTSFRRSTRHSVSYRSRFTRTQ